MEVARLKSKLRETERSKKELGRLVVEGLAIDREVDRCYRKILAGAKKARARSKPDESVEFGDVDEADLVLERKSVKAFVELNK